MKRNILAVVIGLVAAIAIFLVAESINAAIHPAPATLDFTDKAAVETFYNSQPITLWLLVLAGWVLGSVVCGFLIKLISKNHNKRLPIIAGAILTLSAIANFLMLPHPVWFMIIALLLFIPSTLIGHRLYTIK